MKADGSVFVTVIFLICLLCWVALRGLWCILSTKQIQHFFKLTGKTFASAFHVFIYSECVVKLWCPSFKKNPRDFRGPVFLLFHANGSLDNCLSNLVTSVRKFGHLCQIKCKINSSCTDGTCSKIALCTEPSWRFQVLSIFCVCKKKMIH